MAILNQSDFVKARAKVENETVQQIASHFKFSQENNLNQLILSSFDREDMGIIAATVKALGWAK